jgi:hypothetical protein
MRQRHYLQLSVLSAWKAKESRIFSKLRSYCQELTLGGDGRVDSPGHCTKFGSYTMMDLQKHLVIDI